MRKEGLWYVSVSPPLPPPPHLGLGVVQVAGVGQLARLLRQRGQPPRVTVPQSVHGNASGHVNVPGSVECGVTNVSAGG